MKARLYPLFFLICLYCLLSPSLAQESDSKNEEKLSRSTGVEFFSVSNNQGNDARIIQIQDQNKAYILQQGQNQLQVNQNGFSNFASLNQSGNQNQILVDQYGANNETAIWTLGQNIRINSNQIGDENLIRAFLNNQGNNPQTALLNQYGNQNRIDIASVSAAGALRESGRVQVNQQGDGNVFSASLDPFGSPISVTQTSGVGGQGMRLHISTNAFPWTGIK
ncbi:curlin repeat-containing protein [Algoriphagus taiwanensis]|uniref:Curlin associated repeat-containing protein n=1 Tax=Algoriphagus taiwanensis TaxID=1445656 RepID=A0ABQ6Q5D9_9BACT|nr:hypothetical protein Ataiwa_36670 [Algoriphagus taiwanensis]